MNILRVIPSVDPRGGGPIELARAIDSELMRRGHNVELACLDSPRDEFTNHYPALVHTLGPAYSNYRFCRRLTTWLAEEAARFDAVVVDGIWQYHSYAARSALKGSAIPYFVFTHGMLGPWFKQKYPLKHLKKWLYWPWADYRVLRDARAVIFMCEEERRLAKQSFWLYQAAEAVAIPGTASPPERERELAECFLNEIRLPRDSRIILFLGRINEVKGCDILVQSFARIAHHDSRLRLVIAGPDEDNWRAKLLEIGLRLGVSDRIVWTGMLKGDSKWGALYASDILCLPSHHENFGLVVAEALACGKPVLISNKVNIWREIESDQVGFVDDDTVEGTVRNLRNWLAMDGAAYSAMRIRARQSFERRFHVRRATDRFLQVLQADRSGS